MDKADALLTEFSKLDPNQQEQVLNFARVLAQTTPLKGESGQSIIQATGFFSPQALDEIESAIQADCEEIDWRGWE